MAHTRFQRIISACTVIGAFGSVGVLSAQSFVPQDQFQYQDSQFQQYQDPQLLTPPYSWSSSSSFPGFGDDLRAPPPQGGYLACMQAAEARKEQVGVQLYAWMYQQMTIARQRQAQRRIAAWNIPDDRARREEQRDIDREYRETLRAIDDQFDDVADDVMDRYRDERRECDRLDDDDRRYFSSRSSRSSFPWDPGHSSSSFPPTTGGYGGQGGNCAPIVCSNGRTFPRCTAEGYPINYFADPCVYN